MATRWIVTGPGCEHGAVIEAPNAWRAAYTASETVPTLRGRLIRTEPDRHRAGVSWPLTGPVAGKMERLHVKRAPRGGNSE